MAIQQNFWIGLELHNIQSNEQMTVLKAAFEKYFPPGMYSPDTVTVHFIAVQSISRKEIYPIISSRNNVPTTNRVIDIYVYILDTNVDYRNSGIFGGLIYGKPEHYIIISNLKLKMQIAKKIKKLRELLYISSTFDACNFSLPDYMKVDVLMGDNGISVPDYVLEVIEKCKLISEKKAQFRKCGLPEISNCSDTILLKPNGMRSKLAGFNYFITNKIGHSNWDKMTLSEREMLFLHIHQDKKFCEYYSVNSVDDLHTRGLF